MTRAARFAWNWGWVFISSFLLVAFLCAVSMAAILSLHNSQIAKQLAEQNAQTIASFGKSPFIRVSWDTLQINDGPIQLPPPHLIYGHDCDVLKPVRHAFVTEPMSVLVGKEWIEAGPYDPIRLPAGSELFSPHSPNKMTPTILLGSNLPHGIPLFYLTYLQDTSRPSPPYQMQVLPVCILNRGAQTPEHGCPKQPPETDAQQAQCPVYTTPQSRPQ